MKRKVIQLSGSTLSVTLPAKWARKFNVKKGDELEVHMSHDQLIISPAKGTINDKTTVDVSGTDPITYRIVGALYKAGYDEAEIRFSTTEELKIVKTIVGRETLGYAITQQGENHILVKRVSSVDTMEFDSILRRMFHLLSHISSEALTAIEKEDTEALKHIAILDLEINKLTDFCRRILNKHGYLLFRRTPPVYFIVEQLEKIGDIYRDICKDRIENPENKISKAENTLFKKVNLFFKGFQELYYNFSLPSMASWAKIRYELRDTFNKYLNEGKYNSLLISNLKNITESTFDMNGPLMAARL